MLLFQFGLFCTRWLIKFLIALLVYHKSRCQKDSWYTKINNLWWAFQFSIELTLWAEYVSWILQTLLYTYIWRSILRLIEEIIHQNQSIISYHTIQLFVLRNTLLFIENKRNSILHSWFLSSKLEGIKRRHLLFCFFERDDMPINIHYINKALYKISEDDFLWTKNVAASFVTVGKSWN